ncbi:type I toxin-antitoxin system endodeoxyribonuclease toxin RalR [Escherichia coli]|uniref:type I toxin-antitoxin system endodeoxyribonuclease toxin RalR n=2 Tax=Escherichia coli TaxID=562 RepID=UPI000BB8E91A|nr:type I toxin-antitoxin system endodeoxyribonuclease toxin RalR [Escherichia coli]MCH6351909.1 type I toxin-antitoxin system endodeoxyribonuclease toxin RalR [Escherichia coli]MDY7464974.1 type I toxin-antitoxin system endodeoxyribonuclease toxin RalR [Escherichia coli]QHD12491.1 type I toxin-antitoxin system endodeoxyribonuclease toxin RalR [Escherichia coli]QSW11916.1 type I toxin-antitoxin system endodeoxyribonuclease toxin RalR [Escherichia coli]WAX92551.1 type I toxin-antitoxin system e
MRYDNVKPCPFCGCPSVTVKAISGYYRAKCNGCESRTGYGGSEKEALERWNKRTEPPRKSWRLNSLRKR